MNTPDLVGECGLVDSDYPNLYLPDRLWQALPASTETSFGWLNECLQWEPVRKRVKDAATGTSNSMKNISKGAFLAIEVPVPPPDTQRSIAGALGALSQEIALEVAGVRKLTKLKRGLTFDLLGDKARAQ
jgi:type I restriction enzyme S subunit